MATATKILSIAAKEIGYSRWNDPLQGTKYGRWYAEDHGAYFGTNGVPYCAMFVSWVFAQAGQKAPGLPTAACGNIRNAAKGTKYQVTNKKNAKPGDIVLFRWDKNVNNFSYSDHVGIVEKNCGTYIQTIEGNTSSGNSGSQGNGGGVYRRTRNWDVVQMIIRPAYDGASSSNSSSSSSSNKKWSKVEVDGWIGKESNTSWQIQLGCKIVDGVITDQDPVNKKYLPNITAITWTADGGSNQVLALQNFLIKKGYKIKADRYLGPKTVLALQEWMTDELGYTKHGHDGIFGINTAANVQNAINLGAFAK